MKPNFIILQLPEGASHVEIYNNDILYELPNNRVGECIELEYSNPTLHCTRDTATEELAREVFRGGDWVSSYQCDFDLNKIGEELDTFWVGKKPYHSAIDALHSLAESRGFKNWVIIKKS